MATSQSSERPLRRDAERNRQLILAAAREVFATRGLDAGLDEIARHAGLGVGTVYRRFPDKEQLIDALFEERVDAVREVAEHALSLEDPWEGFTHFMEGGLALQMADRGLKELLLSTRPGLERVAQARQRIRPLANAVIERAQEAGVLRADFGASEIPLLHLMLGGVIDACREEKPELWRRYLAVLLAGLRADAAAPLPVGALDEDALQRVLACRHTSR